MEEKNLKLAQEDIEEALSAVEALEKTLDADPESREVIKEKFMFLSEKLQQLEEILKSEGIL
jgi:hypothetical protein